MSNLCIIPARGGSKRVPRKNIKDFLGKPIISYPIKVALDSGLFDDVMVSTEDNEIAQIAQKYGAKVPFLRTTDNADDFATLAEVIDEVKTSYLKLGISFDNICCVLPTSPLISLVNLKKGYELLINENLDSVRPVVRFSYPVQRSIKLTNGKIEFFYPEYAKTRSQDLESSYHDAGQFYWMKFNKGLNGINRFGFEIPELHVQDIDTIEDWKLAEIKFQIINK